MNIAGAQIRPTAVTILGWLWVVFGSFALFVSCMIMVMFRFMGQWAPGELPPAQKNMPPGFGPMAWVFQHFTTIAAGQLVVSAFSIYAAVAFLRLRAWSRTYFEILNWLALLYTVGFGAYWVFMWRGIAGNIPTSPASNVGPPAAVFGAMGVVMGVLVTVFNAAIPVLFIWLLRSRHVRPAFVSA